MSVMSRLRVKTGATAAAAMIALTGNAVASPLFVYKGNGSDGRKALPAFESYIGRKVDGVVDFVQADSWTNFDNDAAWGVSGWKGSGYQLAESVPLTVSGTSLGDVAAGKEDIHYVKLAQTLVSNGFPNAYVRLGWEFNGGWYAWAASGHAKDYTNAFRHIVQVMKAAPGANFKFVWNTALGMQQVWPDQVYPGDDVVDVIGTDVYDQGWDVGYTIPATRWNSLLNDNWALQAVIAFAKKHAKPYAFPEWGVGTRPDGHGGGDDPLFVHNMVPFVAGAAFSGYWDYAAGDFNGQISNNKFPLAGAEFKTDFGGNGGSAGTNPQAVAPPPAPQPAPPSTPAPNVKPITATVDHGGSVSVEPQADGSAFLDLKFTPQKTAITYNVSISALRSIGWSASSVWFRSNKFTWAVAAGKSSTGRVWVGAK